MFGWQDAIIKLLCKQPPKERDPMLEEMWVKEFYYTSYKGSVLEGSEQ
jgi:hypothetical protein